MFSKHTVVNFQLQRNLELFQKTPNNLIQFQKKMCAKKKGKRKKSAIQMKMSV